MTEIVSTFQNFLCHVIYKVKFEVKRLLSLNKQILEIF